MSNIRLSSEEIRKRLIRLRNLEQLHENQRFKIWHLRDDKRELKQEVAKLKAVVSQQQKDLQDLKLQVEELKTIVFGKKNQKTDIDGDDDHEPPKDKPPRSNDSYQRPLPKEEEITETKPGNNGDAFNPFEGKEKIKEKEVSVWIKKV